jgi:hypothetical protein
MGEPGNGSQDAKQTKPTNRAADDGGGGGGGDTAMDTTANDNDQSGSNNGESSSTSVQANIDSSTSSSNRSTPPPQVPPQSSNTLHSTQQHPNRTITNTSTLQAKKKKKTKKNGATNYQTNVNRIQHSSNREIRSDGSSSTTATTKTTTTTTASNRKTDRKSATISTKTTTITTTERRPRRPLHASTLQQRGKILDPIDESKVVVPSSTRKPNTLDHWNNFFFRRTSLEGCRLGGIMRISFAVVFLMERYILSRDWEFLISPSKGMIPAQLDWPPTLTSWSLFHLQQNADDEFYQQIFHLSIVQGILLLLGILPRLQMLGIFIHLVSLHRHNDIMFDYEDTLLRLWYVICHSLEN